MNNIEFLEYMNQFEIGDYVHFTQYGNSYYGIVAIKLYPKNQNGITGANYIGIFLNKDTILDNRIYSGIFDKNHNFEINFEFEMALNIDDYHLQRIIWIKGSDNYKIMKVSL